MFLNVFSVTVTFNSFLHLYILLTVTTNSNRTDISVQTLKQIIMAMLSLKIQLPRNVFTHTRLSIINIKSPDKYVTLCTRLWERWVSARISLGNNTGRLSSLMLLTIVKNLQLSLLSSYLPLSWNGEQEEGIKIKNGVITKYLLP